VFLAAAHLPLWVFRHLVAHPILLIVLRYTPVVAGHPTLMWVVALELVALVAIAGVVAAVLPDILEMVGMVGLAVLRLMALLVAEAEAVAEPEV
jgi:hypothetical protein